jgi:hypothetical protein
VVVKARGSSLSHVASCMLWNPTDVEAIVLEIISPAGMEGFFEEIGGLNEEVSPEAVPEIRNRYG